ncbi:MAG TPA: rhomboid family intramembrane serine protease [Candidatus Angelobacter sp.]|nr:rhomboid family intramembrane serine protease [Candidatus Angelobacter sp.]
MPACAKCGSPLQVNEEGIAPVLCDRCAGVAVSRASKGMYTGTMRDYPVTALLAAINVGVFVAMVASGVSFVDPKGPDLVKWGGNWGVLTLGGEYWRLLTAAFVHGGIIHIVLNMWCLLSFGPIAERLFGRWQTLAIYLFTGVGGSLLSIGYDHQRLSVGASGAIFGIAGALLSGVRLGNLSITTGQKRSIFSSIAMFAFYSFAWGMQPGMDNMCHLGGFVTGLILGVPLAAPSTSKSKHTLIQIATLLATAALLAVAGNQLAQTHGQMFKAENLIEHEDYAGAIQLLERRTASHPDDEDAWMQLGHAYELNHQPEKGLDAFEKAARVNPNNSKIQTALGFAYRATGQVDKEIAAFEEATRLNPADSQVLMVLGFAYEKKQQPEKAIVAFEQALQLDPNLDDARQELQALRQRSPEPKSKATEN